jgi:hypothetical protein
VPLPHADEEREEREERESTTVEIHSRITNGGFHAA